MNKNQTFIQVLYEVHEIPKQNQIAESKYLKQMHIRNSKQRKQHRFSTQRTWQTTKEDSNYIYDCGRAETPGKLDTAELN